MESNELEKIDHILAAINEMGSKTEDVVEKKKNEKIMAAGGSLASRELKELHDKFMISAKESLENDVKSGKIPEAVARFVLSVLRQSHEVVKKFVVDKTAQLNTKTGEVLGLETSVKLLKVYYDSFEVKKNAEIARHKELEEQKKQEIQASTESTESTPIAPVTFANVLETETLLPPKKQRKARSRPDEVGHHAKTVKRIKESRKKS